MEHYVYIVQCSDDTLYTGYTTDVKRRIKEHNQGRGAKYTRGRGPVRLCHTEEYTTRSQAQRREYVIKQLTRQQKLKLIKGELDE
ncbi:GIY-YIG nuclease family protein [Natroniella sp. ANB-PHB2]|uniref:GIY-YIG nuclease family protein n=1 Tax=Natroniella sp. ANB-PHB2 TaxID=3384444 RepID=UPI0038D3FF71